MNHSKEKINWISSGQDQKHATEPMATRVVAGQIEHIPVSLLPHLKSEELDADKISLERSSSSFLKDAETPPSTLSEDEPGQMGFQFLCFGRKRHHVDSLYNDVHEKDRFGCVVLFFVILSYIPAVFVQGAYYHYRDENKQTHKQVQILREHLLNNYIWVIFTFSLMACLSLVLKFFTGLARRYPFHIIMICLKSICFAVLLLTAAALTEFSLVCFRIRMDVRYDETVFETGTWTWEMLYTEYVKQDWGNTAEENPYGLVVYNAMDCYFIGSLYGLFLLILMFILVTCSKKISFFGPTYPFISYTLSFAIIIGSTTYALYTEEMTHSGDDILWELFQHMFSPIFGCVLAEMFVEFLEKLFDGKLGPIKSGEFLYAVAHY